MSSPYAAEEADLEQCRADVVSLWVNNLSHRSATDAETKLRVGHLDYPAGRLCCVLQRAPRRSAGIPAQPHRGDMKTAVLISGT